MKLKAGTNKLETGGTFESKGFVVEANDPAIIEILTQKIYQDPLVFPRELMANAMDAGGVADLQLPDALTPSWEVEDHGAGMTHEFMMDGYSRIFHSTKRNTDKDIGGFGHGRLSPIAYTDSYTVRSRFKHTDGVIMEGHYMIYRGANKVPQISCTLMQKSEVQQTGVRVSVPIADKDHAIILKKTTYYGQYLAKTPPGIAPVKYEFQNKDGGFRPFPTNWSRYGRNDGVNDVQPRIIVGGVPYPAPNHYIPADIPLDVFFNVGEIPVTLSRDAIEHSEAVRKKIQTKADGLYTAYLADLQSKIDVETTAFDKWVKTKQVANRDNVSYALGNVVFYKIKSADHLAGKTLTKATKSDFAVHLFTSDIDRDAWEKMDETTRSFRSLNILKVHMLADKGIIQRRNGDALDTASLNFREAFSVDKDGKLNLAVFAVGLPYTQGSVKKIKDAIASKLGELRTKNPGKLKRIPVLLIQYEDKAEAEKIVGLISSKLDINWIDSTGISKGKLATYAPIAYVAKDDKARQIRCQALSENVIGAMPDVIYIVREVGQTERQAVDVLSTVRNVFPDNTLVSIHSKFVGKLPKDAKELKGALISYIKTKYGYPYDTKPLNAYHEADRNFRRQDMYETLRGEVVGGGTFYKLALADKRIQAVPELATVFEHVRDVEVRHGQGPKQDIQTIQDMAFTIKTWVNCKLLTEAELPAPTKVFPTQKTTEENLLAEFSDKYPFMIAVKQNYDWRHRGVPKKLFDHALDYLVKFN